MANYYDFNPFDPPVPKQPGIDPKTGKPFNSMQGQMEDGNPNIPPTPIIGGQVVRNPYAPTSSTWATWQQPTDESARLYYKDHPREAYQQFQNAWGQPNGNLQKFIDNEFGRVYADYVRLTEQKNNPGKDFQFTDTLTKGLGDQMQQQWQGQTAYQRGENYGVMNAGRRT